MPSLQNPNPKRLIVGLSGASGAIMTVCLLKALRAAKIESHLIASKTGIQTLVYETKVSYQELKALADFHYHSDDFAAAISSGSFKTMGMVVVPCSVRSLAEIASGVTTSLLTRAADVTLKERRKLVLMVREAPLSLSHIRNMETVTLMGGIISPPLPIFYAKPRDLDEMVDQMIGRLLDLYEIDSQLVSRWGE